MNEERMNPAQAVVGPRTDQDAKPSVGPVHAVFEVGIFASSVENAKAIQKEIRDALGYSAYIKDCNGE